MPDFDKALVVTHIVYREISPYDALEGPYSSVCHALTLILKEVETCQIPLSGFNGSLIYGQWKKGRKLKVPSFLGKLAVLKYLIDIFITVFFVIRFNLTNRNKKRLVIGIDPLSCFPLGFLKKILNYQLVFYSVDFNKNRFGNKILQRLYEKADEISARLSDQTWVVCQSLKDYKKNNYQVESFYIPNSPIYNGALYEQGKSLKTGNKMAWTGSFLTERQGRILFATLKEVQDKARPDLEFYFAPIGSRRKIKEYCQKYKLKKCKVLDLRSRLEWQKFVSKCDVGIALYDDKFGSTEFIEPLKIWDFMMCGLPFIISSEPSIATPIQKAGVAYFLNPGNKIPQDNSLKEFLKPKNIQKLQTKCLEIAKEYDISKQIEKALKKI